ncbi:uncharacterized protein LOC112568015 isoform X2 [Pomacea canaliculata]|nr:uncharacterized protein LOC112568015 isoform X2 [Pomacea canaliculata]XP_025100789.1 uncharacterized protein LOC112568015 isoform X2 [Pomacea canaliculata]
MAEQKLIELAEAAASLTDAEAKACINNGDHPCGGVVISGGSSKTKISQPVVLDDEMPPVMSNTFCPVGYVTKPRPQYVKRLFDVNFPYPEISYPYHGGLPLSPSFTEASPFFRADHHVVAEEDAAKEIPDLEMETLDLTSTTSLTPLKALDLLSDVSSRVVVAPEVPVSGGGGLDYVSSNLSVVTLRVPDSSLPVSQTLGATAQSESEYSLHDIKMRLEVRANTGDFPPSEPYVSSEGATFLNDELPMESVGSGELRNIRDCLQQQKGAVGWAGNAEQVDIRAQKYFSYWSPHPHVQTYLEPVHHFPATSSATATAAAVATLPEISVFVPPNAQSKSAAQYSYSNHAMALPHAEYHQQQTARYYKAETTVDAKASVIKMFSNTRAKGRAIYKMYPPMPPPLQLMGGRTPATVLNASENRSEELNHVIKTDIETEAAPQFDPLSIVVEEVCSQPHEKEILDPFRDSLVDGSVNRNRKSVLCCRKCFRCPSSSADFCLLSSPGEMPRGHARKLKIKLKKEPGDAVTKNIHSAAVVIRRSRLNSTLSCPFCPRFFANTSNVARHIRIFHPANYKPRRTLTQNVCKPLARSNGWRCKSANAVSVGIQCTLASSAADDAMVGSVLYPTTTTITKSKGSTPDYAAESTAGKSDGGRAVVTSSFSGTDRSWGARTPRDKSKSTKVSAETDVSSSLTPRPAKTRERKTKQRKTSVTGSIPPPPLVLPPSVNATKRGSVTYSTPRQHSSPKRSLPSSVKKLSHKFSSSPSSTENLPSSTSIRPLNFRTKPRTRVNSKIPCPYCPRFFSVMSNLKRHTRMQHSDVFVFDCNVCLRKFSMRRTLKKHMLDHAHDRPFQCADCLSRFEFRDQLRVHGQRHVIEKFPCHDCGLTFYTLNHLKQHLQLHH